MKVGRNLGYGSHGHVEAMASFSRSDYGLDPDVGHHIDRLDCRYPDCPLQVHEVVIWKCLFKKIEISICFVFRKFLVSV